MNWKSNNDSIYSKNAETLSAPSIKELSRVINPVITKDIVTDRLDVKGTADPFIVFDEGKYHMFFEVLGGLNQSTGLTADEIGHAWSYDLENWNYTKVVISKEVHGHRSAYPHVFKYENDWYMLPDTAGNIYLYKAKDFPLTWELHGKLLSGSFSDTNVFEMGGVWFLTTSLSPYTNLRLYYNTSGDWRNSSWELHPLSPIIDENLNESGLRGAGNPFVFDDYVILPIQATPKDSSQYGEYTYWYKLSNLTTTTCEVTNLGFALTAQRNSDWNNVAIHHISHVKHSNRNIYAVDGLQVNNLDYKIGIYTDGDQLIATSSKINSDLSLSATTWTPLSLVRGEYDTYYVHDRTTGELRLKTSGLYGINVQIGNKNAIFRVKADGVVIFEGVSESGYKMVSVQSPCLLTVEVYSDTAVTVSSAKTFIQIKKL